MPIMAPSKTIRTRVTDEIDAALRAYCEQHGISLSDLLREAALEKIDRPDLIETMPPQGRPRSADSTDQVP